MHPESTLYRLWRLQQAQALSAHKEFAQTVTIQKNSIYGATLTSYREMIPKKMETDILAFLRAKSLRGSGLRILDVGAGPGYAAEEIKTEKMFPEAQVLALDAQTYPKARPRRDQTLPEITRIQGSYLDVKELLNQEGAADGVDLLLCMRTFFPQLGDKTILSHIAQRRVLHEFSRCLRPSGVALVTMEMNQENLRQMDGFQERLTQRGFSLRFEEMAQDQQGKFTLTPVTDGGKMMVAKLERIK